MDFDEVAVKESPGLCRCCLSEGCYKDLSSEYSWMGETEIYADMLLECFDISVSQHVEGPNGPMRLICEVCITRLRDACNFKKQVQESEKKFVDMVGRGEFRHKASLVYESSASMKEEHSTLQVEYLDELDFGDDADDILKTDVETEQAEDITAIALPVKRGRGRPRKNPDVKSEKKKAKLEREEKPRTSKIRDKGFERLDEDNLDGEPTIRVRRNLSTLLEGSTITPFKRQGNIYQCFFCDMAFIKTKDLKEHTKSEHEGFHTNSILQRAITRNNQIKLDLTDLGCKLCSESFTEFDDIIGHLVKAHDLNYSVGFQNHFMLFKLSDDCLKCFYCGEQFDFFSRLLRHILKEHNRGDYTCEICARSFLFAERLRKHRQEHEEKRKHKCDVCGKLFKSISNKKAHEGNVHGTYNVLCDCGKSFRSVHTLKRHKYFDHDKKAAYSCGDCDKTFFRKGELLKHRNCVHLNIRVSCPICGRGFHEKYLKRHMVSHTDARPFECDICRKAFQRKKTLDLHRRIHTNDKRYACKDCGAAFVQVASLKLHIRVQHSSNDGTSSANCKVSMKKL